MSPLDRKKPVETALEDYLLNFMASSCQAIRKTILET